MKIINTKITQEQLSRLDGIIKKYNFKSRYKLLLYLVECFLKVADPHPDDSVPVELEEMFDGYSELSREDYQGTKKGVSF